MTKRFKDALMPRLTAVFKWLHPGMGIKRWIGLSSFGVILIVIGSNRLRTEEYWVVQILNLVVLLSGIIILILGIRHMMRSLIAAFIPSAKAGDLIDILYQRRQLGRGPKIVAVGGGTGLSVLLTGLKEYTSNITAIVTVADSGGSSGRIREQFDILPPGDIRNCLVALADASTLMRDLFQFRFDSSSEFSGHSFGNLFITVMTRVTGDFEKAVKETSKVLALRGQVIPSTLNKVSLVAEHKDGSITEGEDRIPKANKPIKRVFLKPGDSLGTPEALKAIEEAEIIVLGPGSLYTSIVPNLLIKEITDTIVASDAIKVYVCNVMTQLGETDGYRASDHIRALVQHSHPHILDYCVLNSGQVPENLRQRYAKERAYPVVNDSRTIEGMGYRVIENVVMGIEDLARHDASKLASMIVGFIEEI
jgi:uncharacterized cofD-like protein